MAVKDYLRQMLEKGASDLYFKSGSPPHFRIDDKISPVSDEKMPPSDIQKIVDSFLTSKQKKIFEEEKELDAAYSVSGMGRFRFNLYIQRGTLALTFRSIKVKVPSFDELNLPAKVMENLSSQPRGLILITGHAGSGKSTSLAAMIDYMNRNFDKHIITVEDPIEFLHTDKKSIISQREVGTDTKSFGNALRHVIRQSPDVILIGEMRDAETIRIAIMAAETGHLVLSTLHTIDTTQAIDRIINYFPSHAHGQVRLQLSQLLRGIISMRLIPRSDRDGRIPACEIMLSTPTVRKMIMDGKTNQLMPVIEDGKLFGMQSFNQALIGWMKKKVISKESALNYASNPDELSLKMQEIFPGRQVR